jgi:probable rRNA maturation factor
MDIMIRVSSRTQIPLKRSDIERTAARMLKNIGVRRAELSVVFLDAHAMRQLNRKYLGHDRVTDVISFNLRDSIGLQEHRSTGAQVKRRRSCAHVLLCSCAQGGIDGEIYICPAEARRNAKCYGEPVKRELLRYLAHGILHLLGFDDATAEQRQRMRTMEDELLKA